MNLNLHFTSHTNIFQIDYKCNIKAKTMKLVEENMRISSQLWGRQKVLREEKERKKDKLYVIKVKNVQSSKDTINEMIK